MIKIHINTFKNSLVVSVITPIAVVCLPAITTSLVDAGIVKFN